MLVSNNVFKNRYVWDGSQTNFPISFPFLDNNHIQVWYAEPGKPDTDAVILGKENYTITGAGNPAGGVLTRTTAWAVGATIAIVRNVPITQLHQYTQYDNFPAESHEDALAKLTMIDQQQQEILNRSVKLPATDPRSPEEYAQDLLGARDEAEYWAKYAEKQANHTVQVPSETMVLASNSVTPRTLADRFADVVNVKDFGAKGDGVADDTEAINSAIVSAIGKPLRFPAGVYLVSSPIIVYKNSILTGDSMYTTTIKLADNANCNVLETYEWRAFNANGGDNSVQHPTLPVDFSVSNLTIDGNRGVNYTNGVVSDSNDGYGFICYGRSYYIDSLFIKDCAGCGIRFILRRAEGDTQTADSDFNKTRITNIFVHNTSYEGFVFEGGADVFIDNILVGNAHHPQATKNETSLGMSLIFPGESIDGIVFDSYDPEGEVPKSQGTAEVGFLHSYSCMQGYCIRISGIGTRFTAENIHAEGGIGNILISAGVIESIDKIQTRNNQYGAPSIFTRPHVDIQTSSGMNIGTIYVRKFSSEDGINRDCIHVNGNHISVDTVKIFAYNHAGHGVVVSKALSIGLIYAVSLNGVALDSTPSTALLFSSTNRSATIRQLETSNCDSAVRVVSGGWQEILSGYVYRSDSNTFVAQDTEQVVFDTVPNINALRRWGFVVSDKGKVKYPSFTGKTDNVDTTSIEAQVFTVAHNMWRTPTPQEVALSVFRGATTAPHVKAFWVSATNAEAITVCVVNADGEGDGYAISIKV